MLRYVGEYCVGDGKKRPSCADQGRTATCRASAPRCSACGDAQSGRAGDRGPRVSPCHRSGHDRVRLHAAEKRNQSAAADAQARRRRRDTGAAGRC
jgi:hypothetical protein